MANTAYPNVATQLVRTNGEFGAMAPAVAPATNTVGATVTVAYDAAAWNTGDLLSGLGVGLFVMADTDCHVIFSVDATVGTTATTAHMKIPGGVFLQLPYAKIKTFSAIKAVTAGNIQVTEIIQ
jgi:hypothetical protein